MSYSLRAGSGPNHPDPAHKLSANLYVLLCVQWKTADDGQRDCPKHVEFYSKNKFEKLVHLVGFIVRIYHDAWSAERQGRVNIDSVILQYELCGLWRRAVISVKFSWQVLKNIGDKMTRDSVLVVYVMWWTVQRWAFIRNNEKSRTGGTQNDLHRIVHYSSLWHKNSYQDIIT